MQTVSKQSKSMLVDIDKYVPDASNPLAKAFKHKGSVFGFTAPYRDWETDRKSTRLNSSHRSLSRMPASA